MVVLQQIKHNESCNLLVSYCKFFDNKTFMFVTKKKKKKLDLNFNLCNYVVGYNVRWVRCSGTKGSYSYLKALIARSWFTNMWKR